MLLKNKNATVYGGGGVIGGAVARAFASEGARLFLADVASEGRLSEPLSPRHVRHFTQSDLLDLVGELLAFRLIGRTHSSRG